MQSKLMVRKFNHIDKLINSFDNFITTTLNNPKGTGRNNPAKLLDEKKLSQNETKISAGLMRVNHSGEVCAQALYEGQAFTAKTKKIQQKLKQAALEENDHLLWCAQRLSELNSKKSILNIPLYAGSFAIGAFAGIAGDKWSLGFLAETEKQVGKHLESHLEKLPNDDLKSRSIVKQMYIDETAHEETANNLGAAKLPYILKKLMRITSKLMTKTTYYI